jgi:hypothetical protein
LDGAEDAGDAGETSQVSVAVQRCVEGCAAREDKLSFSEIAKDDCPLGRSSRRYGLETA